MDEQNNEILMKNCETCPIGSISFSKVNAAISDSYFCGYDRASDHGCE